MTGQSPKNTSEIIYTALPGQNEPTAHWWQKFNNDNIYNTLWGATPKATTRTPRTDTSSQKPKRRIQTLEEGETRVKQGNNVVRTGKLTDAEIKQINNNRKAAGQ